MGTVGTTNSAAGFLIWTIASSSSSYGNIVFASLGSNIWTCSGSLHDNNAQYLLLNSGAVTLSSALDRIRVTTVNGTDTFDAGQINVMYEG